MRLHYFQLFTSFYNFLTMSKKGLVFALSIYFSSNLSRTFMGANVDDYYSSMSPDTSGETSKNKKKPLIKKKLIVRPKKVVVKKTPTEDKEVTQGSQPTAGESPENTLETQKTEATLNDAISKAAPKK